MTFEQFRVTKLLLLLGICLGRSGDPKIVQGLVLGSKQSRSGFQPLSLIRNAAGSRVYLEQEMSPAFVRLRRGRRTALDMTKRRLGKKP
jgi:hypothetical protein